MPEEKKKNKRPSYTYRFARTVPQEVVDFVMGSVNEYYSFPSLINDLVIEHLALSAEGKTKFEPPVVMHTGDEERIPVDGGVLLERLNRSGAHAMGAHETAAMSSSLDGYRAEIASLRETIEALVASLARSDGEHRKQFAALVGGIKEIEQAKYKKYSKMAESGAEKDAEIIDRLAALEQALSAAGENAQPSVSHSVADGAPAQETTVVVPPASADGAMKDGITDEGSAVVPSADLSVEDFEHALISVGDIDDYDDVEENAVDAEPAGAPQDDEDVDPVYAMEEVGADEAEAVEEAFSEETAMFTDAFPAVGALLEDDEDAYAEGEGVAADGYDPYGDDEYEDDDAPIAAQSDYSDYGDIADGFDEGYYEPESADAPGIADDASGSGRRRFLEASVPEISAGDEVGERGSSREGEADDVAQLDGGDDDDDFDILRELLGK